MEDVQLNRTLLPSGYVNIAMENDHLYPFIVSFPNKHGDFPVRYVDITRGYFITPQIMVKKSPVPMVTRQVQPSNLIKGPASGQLRSPSGQNFQYNFGAL